MRISLIPFALLLAGGVSAAEETGGWSGTGELGLAVARGNARSENLNTKLNLENEDERWKHKFHLAALRSKGEVKGDFDNDGVPDERFDLTANRYELGASSAIKMNQRAYWVGAVRYEQDDFASYENQTTFALSYGYQAIDNETTQLSAEVGPGYRRAKVASSGETETGAILRGQIDYKHQLTETTSIGNLLLVESGDDNTFAQNDLGVSVAINSRFALKAGIQWRYNSETDPGVQSSDTLTTVNLVYNIK
ncbi:DUF481 domain-containing protein [Pseudomarimonas arenosa]|uniref:DUF481 domain-containing protein n=1 Tax=Pseudomarimonas arenosa TaxID=2774145 RepID=A0AAW3ZKM8_9GAMM|nr:DUF481 domain-containing protein [Pseudomarimonas arenosa]MBD8525475.1 DUF481 domain-containing protein [Pseudomarimonas arenosa]